MKILQLFYKVPFPMLDGGSTSIYHSALSLLSTGADLTILAMDQQSSPGNRKLIPDDFMQRTRFRTVSVDNRVKPFGAFINLFSHQSYFTERFSSGVFERELVETLTNNTFDVIQLEHLYLGRYISLIRKHSKAKVVLRAQNVEHLIWEYYGSGIRNPFLRRYIALATRRLKKFEIVTAISVDGVIALSERDRSWFLGIAPGVPAEAIPIGMDFSRFAGIDPELQFKRFPVFYHLGSMDWKPNAEGIRWFVDEVLPVILPKHPDLVIRLAGKKMPEWLYRKGSKNLIIDGQVDDAVQYQEDKAILLVPLLSGSGIRVKILEAMAMGKAIISTSRGAEGLPVSHGEHLLIADSPHAFAEQMERCMVSEGLCRNLGVAARNLAREKFSLEKTGEATIAFYNTLMG